MPGFQILKNFADRIGSDRGKFSNWRIGSDRPLYLKFPKRIAMDRRGADRFGSDRRIAKVFGRFLPIFRRFLPYFADYNNL